MVIFECQFYYLPTYLAAIPATTYLIGGQVDVPTLPLLTFLAPVPTFCISLPFAILPFPYFLPSSAMPAGFGLVLLHACHHLPFAPLPAPYTCLPARSTLPARCCCSVCLLPYYTLHCHTCLPHSYTLPFLPSPVLSHGPHYCPVKTPPHTLLFSLNPLHYIFYLPALSHSFACYYHYLPVLLSLPYCSSLPVTVHYTYLGCCSYSLFIMFYQVGTVMVGWEVGTGSFTPRWNFPEKEEAGQHNMA